MYFLFLQSTIYKKYLIDATNGFIQSTSISCSGSQFQSEPRVNLRDRTVRVRYRKNPVICRSVRFPVRVTYRITVRSNSPRAVRSHGFLKRRRHIFSFQATEATISKNFHVGFIDRTGALKPRELPFGHKTLTHDRSVASPSLSPVMDASAVKWFGVKLVRPGFPLGNQAKCELPSRCIWSCEHH
jgi:hypothetical protein